MHKIECSLCNVNPINGARFKCLECENLNLCENCEKNESHDHLMLKIQTLNDEKLYDELV